MLIGFEIYFEIYIWNLNEALNKFEKRIFILSKNIVSFIKYEGNEH